MLKNNSINRRDFIRLASTAGAALSLPLQSCNAMDAIQGNKSKMERRLIPSSSTGELMPVIGLGTSMSSYVVEPPEGKQQYIDVLQILLDAGGRLVNTAVWPKQLAQGIDDTILGQLIKEMEIRDDLFIGHMIDVQEGEGREAGVKQLEANDRVYRKRPMDLIEVAGMKNLDTQWKLFKEWKDVGKTRYIGITTIHASDYERIESFMKKEKPDFVQINYSALEYTAEERILPLANDLGIAIMTNRPFMNGRYFGIVKGKQLPEWATEFDCESWAQFSMKYILANPYVTCIITETGNPKHALDNVQGGMGRIPNAEEQLRIRRHLESL